MSFVHWYFYWFNSFKTDSVTNSVASHRCMPCSN